MPTDYARIPSVCVALLLLAVVQVQPARAAGVDPARIVFLLEYVGSDYAGAVRDGTVINQAEYGEVLRFTKEIIREYEARRNGADKVSRGLHDLQRMLERRAPAAEVEAAARTLLPALTKSLQVNDQPSAPPNLAAGRRLWTDDCAPCHGSSGGGDGPSAPDLEPRPTAFDADFLEHVSPRRVFNAMTFGIDGTGMPSFVPAYSEPQRWDVAFFVMTLRPDFAPQRPPSATRVTLEQVATSSNAELLARLQEERAGASTKEVDWLRTNFPSPAGSNAPIAGSDAGVATALQLQNVFAGVADRIFPRVVGVSGYVRETAPAPTPAQDGWTNDSEVQYPGFRAVRSGTGFLVDEEGYVLSRNYLVRDEHGELVQFVDVELQNQSHMAARVVGAEPALDLAVLQVADVESLSPGPALELADSDQVRLGQWLIALGDPPGPSKTLTVGLASAPPERQCYQSERSATRLQTSLIVPSDGLGGPITDILGHVVGMSVKQPDPPGTAAADGPTSTHVLPINLVLNLYEALKVAHSKQSPWLGVSVLELPSLRHQLGEKASAMAIPRTGVYIDDVFDPSPAARAGVRPGDFLVGLGGHPLLSVGNFQMWLYVLGIGKEIELELQRDGHPLRVMATIEVRPESATTR